MQLKLLRIKFKRTVKLCSTTKEIFEFPLGYCINADVVPVPCSDGIERANLIFPSGDCVLGVPYHQFSFEDI